MTEMRVNAWLLRPMLDLVNAAAGNRAVLPVWSSVPSASAEVGVLYAFVSYIGRVVDP